MAVSSALALQPSHTLLCPLSTHSGGGCEWPCVETDCEYVYKGGITLGFNERRRDKLAKAAKLEIGLTPNYHARSDRGSRRAQAA